jgi:hypothetical protein
LVITSGRTRRWTECLHSPGILPHILYSTPILSYIFNTHLGKFCVIKIQFCVMFRCLPVYTLNLAFSLTNWSLMQTQWESRSFQSLFFQQSISYFPD